MKGEDPIKRLIKDRWGLQSSTPMRPDGVMVDDEIEPVTSRPNPPCGQQGHLANVAWDERGNRYTVCCEPTRNRWAAFTDDELDCLEDGMSEVVARFGPMGDGDEVLRDEIRAEIERRNGEA